MPSCTECEKTLCDYRICKCNCHIDSNYCAENDFNHNESTMNTTIVQPNLSLNKSAAAIQDNSVDHVKPKLNGNQTAAAIQENKITHSQNKNSSILRNNANVKLKF